MPWSRHNREPDPLKAKRRQLDEQQRLLAERMSQLTHELQHGNEAGAKARKTPEPPVWRMEEDAPPRPKMESAGPRKKNLARQLRRDRLIFFLLVGLLLIATALVLWLWKTHVPGPE